MYTTREHGDRDKSIKLAFGLECSQSVPHWYVNPSLDSASLVVLLLTLLLNFVSMQQYITVWSLKRHLHSRIAGSILLWPPDLLLLYRDGFLL